MEREVRYCTTTDGVSIAYWTLGDGPPLMYIPEPVLTASAADDKLPATKRWYDSLSSNRRVIRFDHRGTGLSRHNNDYSLDALERDVSAVVDALGLASFDLWGDMDGGIVAAAYAAHHPEHVRRLILWNSWARAADIPENETLQTLDRLIDLNWALYARTASTMDSDWSGDEALQYAQYLMAGCEPAVARKFVTATWEFDVTDLLPKITCETLVMHRRDHRFFPQRLGQQLAASIPRARLALVDGNSFYPWFEQPELVLGLVNAFAPPGPALQPEARERHARPVAGAAVRTVLFTDLVGHTEMMRRLGDVRGRAVLREHEQITREHISRFGGTEIKTDGDSFMVSFSSVTAAVDCAVELQRALARRNDAAAEPLRVRIGLDAGEPIEEHGDLFGSTVIMASRIAAQAGAGEILIPDPLRHLLSGKSYVYADRGEAMLKGFEDAVRLYEVRWRE